MKIVRVLSLAAVIGIALPVIAWASHGKAGLWEINVRTNMSQIQGMPDTSKLPPEVRARIQAMNSNGVTVHHCMTAADVNNDKPVMSQNKYCSASNVKAVGQTFNVDIVCTGKMNGQGHVQFTFDSPEHYAGIETMNGTANGHPVNSSMAINARWISADCGSVH